MNYCGGSHPKPWAVGSSVGIVFALSATLAFGAAPTVAPQGDGSSDRELLRLAAESYQAHRESFPQLKLEYLWIEGEAESAGQAFSGSLSEENERSEAFLIHAGGMRRYGRRCSEAAVKEYHETMRASGSEDSETLLSVPCAGYEVLEANGFTLRHTTTGRSANLYAPGDGRGGGVRCSPFNIDFMGSDEKSSPYRFIQDGLSGRFPIRLAESAAGSDDDSSSGDDVTALIEGSNYDYRYSFDPNRDFILTRASMTDRKSGKRLYEMRLLEAKECSGGRWLPTAAVKVQYPDDDGPIRVFKAAVEAFDAQYEPLPTDFVVDIPPGTQVSSPIRIEWAMLEEGVEVGPDDLAELNEIIVARGERYQEKREIAAKSAAGRTSSRSEGDFGWRGWLVAVNVIVILGLGVLFLLRRRRGVGTAP